VEGNDGDPQLADDMFETMYEAPRHWARGDPGRANLAAITMSLAKKDENG